MIFDFRLKVFHTVATRLNFTKAADELCITQPAVSRHIQETESYFKTKLFERTGSRIRLTEAGTLLLQQTEKIFDLYRETEVKIGQLTLDYKGVVRIGASTTIAQYILPPALADFHKKYPDVKIELSIDNTEQIERSLEQEKIDLGIIEGRTKNMLFRYLEFLKDEIVVVCREGHPLTKKEVVTVEDLLQTPVLMREPGSGTLEVIAFAMKSLGLNLSQLQVELQLSNVNSIKSYLQNSDCLAFLSIFTVVEELTSGKLHVVDIADLKIDRSFFIIQPHGNMHKSVDLLLKFFANYNFKT